MKRSTAIWFAIYVTVLGGFWVAGFDFPTERGAEATLLFAFTAYCIGAAIILGRLP